MLFSEIAFGRVLDYKENPLNLMLMVWVLILSSTHFAFY